MAAMTSSAETACGVKWLGVAADSRNSTPCRSAPGVWAAVKEKKEAFKPALRLQAEGLILSKPVRGGAKNRQTGH